MVQHGKIMRKIFYLI